MKEYTQDPVLEQTELASVDEWMIDSKNVDIEVSEIVEGH